MFGWLKRNKDERKKEKVLLSDNGSLYLNLDNPEVAKRLTNSLNFELIDELRRAQKNTVASRDKAFSMTFDYTSESSVKVSP